MAYTIAWRMGPQVLDVTFSGEVTESDLIYSSEAITDLLAFADAPVHILYNGLDVQDFPRSMIVLKRVLRRFCALPSMGWLFFVGFNTPDLRYVGNAIMQVKLRNFKSVHSLEDLDYLLQQIDPTLQLVTDKTSV